MLLKIPIFENLSLRELRFIEKLIYVRKYASGEPIFQQGDPSLGMYVVKTGAVKIIRQLPGGEPRLLATLTAGEFFGELGLIDDAPRSAAAVAHDATETIGFFKPDLMSLIHRRPDLGLKILLSVATTLSARLRHAHEELERPGECAVPHQHRRLDLRRRREFVEHELAARGAFELGAQLGHTLARCPADDHERTTRRPGLRNGFELFDVGQESPARCSPCCCARRQERV